MIYKERHGPCALRKVYVTSYMSLGKLHNLAVPSFSHLCSGDNSGTNLTALLWEICEIIFIWPLAHCLAPNKCSKMRSVASVYGELAMHQLNTQTTFYVLSFNPGRQVLSLSPALKQMRQRKIKKVTKDHIASKWEIWDSNPEPGSKVHSPNDTQFNDTNCLWLLADGENYHPKP